MSAPIGCVLVFDDGRGLQYLRPHHLGRRERLERACLCPELSAAFIFPTRSAANVARDAVRASGAAWTDELEVRELVLVHQAAAIHDEVLELARSWAAALLDPDRRTSRDEIDRTHSSEMRDLALRMSGYEFVASGGDPLSHCQTGPQKGSRHRFDSSSFCIRCGSLSDGALVRCDDDASTDGSWGAWKRANESLAARFGELEAALARGRHEEPAGGSAAWSIELVQHEEEWTTARETIASLAARVAPELVIRGCAACGGGGPGSGRDHTCPVCEPACTCGAIARGEIGHAHSCPEATS